MVPSPSTLNPQPSALGPLPSTLNPQLSTVLRLRRLPYPYRAALAICSDLDETADAQVYAEQMRFLNTREQTSMGPGVGLEVGNTIYFDMPPGQFAYWTTDDAGRAMARALMRSGHIDCLHSYGDLATTRAHAVRALEELERHQISLKVWIDHAIAPTNFGADIMQGYGDEPGHPAYHADLTLRHGVRYVWRGRVTSIIGQDRPVRLARLISDLCPLTSAFGLRSSALCPQSSASALLKEAAKQTLGRLGRRKYRVHARNRLLNPSHLRDGQPTVEFLRCNPHPAGVDTGDTGAGLGEVLTARFLDQLVAREGACLLYTHLGKLSGRVFDEAAIRALHLIARYAAEGRILVTTTRRLLDYARLTESTSLSVTEDAQTGVLNVTCDPAWTVEECQGLTLYPSSPVTELRLNGQAVPMQRHAADETGRASVSIPWTPLKFPVI
jgi:hypothetical protein